jgi:hypothetical protein
MSTIAVPFVNLNGTMRQSLQDDLWEAAGKIEEAIISLRETSPHPRDYPMVGNVTPTRHWMVARDEFHARLAKLEHVKAELHMLFDILDAGSDHTNSGAVEAQRPGSAEHYAALQSAEVRVAEAERRGGRPSCAE